MIEKYSEVNPKKGFVKREDWEDYADISSNGEFTILEEKLKQKELKKSRELYVKRKKALEEDYDRELFKWYYNDSFFEDLED